MGPGRVQQAENKATRFRGNLTRPRTLDSKFILRAHHGPDRRPGRGPCRVLPVVEGWKFVSVIPAAACPARISSAVAPSLCAACGPRPPAGVGAANRRRRRGRRDMFRNVGGRFRLAVLPSTPPAAACGRVAGSFVSRGNFDEEFGRAAPVLVGPVPRRRCAGRSGARGRRARRRRSGISPALRRRALDAAKTSVCAA